MLLKESVQQGQKLSQLVVPEISRLIFRHIMVTCGNQGHAHTLSTMKRLLFWPGMDASVSQKIN